MVRVVVKRGKVCVGDGGVVDRCVWLDNVWKRGMMLGSILVDVRGGGSVESLVNVSDIYWSAW